jgi:hypothetical protein
MRISPFCSNVLNYEKENDIPTQVMRYLPMIRNIRPLFGLNPLRQICAPFKQAIKNTLILPDLNTSSWRREHHYFWDDPKSLNQASLEDIQKIFTCDIAIDEKENCGYFLNQLESGYYTRLLSRLQELFH